MTIRLLDAIAAAERRSEVHEARLVVLLHATGASEKKPLDGITKLAKLDFLLRYPVALERALAAAGRDATTAAVTEVERQSIEAKMIRFRYGPWDKRYRVWLGILNARQLVGLLVQGRTVNIALRTEGDLIATQLIERPEFRDLAQRAKLIATAFGAQSGTRLAEMMYRVFPELLSMAWGSEISL